MLGHYGMKYTERTAKSSAATLPSFIYDSEQLVHIPHEKDSDAMSLDNDEMDLMTMNINIH